MRLTAIAVALYCLAGALPGTAQAQGTGGAPIPLHVSVRKEDTVFTAPCYTVFVSVVNGGSNKFAFRLPDDYLLSGDPQSGTVTLANPQGSSSITFSVLDTRSDDTSVLSGDDFRERVLRDFPSATIVQESLQYALGKKGPGYDLQWKASGRIVECKRVLYISSDAGMLRFTATTSRKDFEAVKSALEGVLRSLHFSANGVIKLPPIRNDS